MSREAITFSGSRAEGAARRATPVARVVSMEVTFNRVYALRSEKSDGVGAERHQVVPLEEIGFRNRPSPHSVPRSVFKVSAFSWRQNGTGVHSDWHKTGSSLAVCRGDGPQNQGLCHEKQLAKIRWDE